MNLAIGMYEAIDTVNIRKEPRIVESKILGKWINNRVGQLDAGDQRMIYSIVTDSNNYTWGRVSQNDSAGVALWVCINTTNKVFMKPVDDYVTPVVNPPALSTEFISRFLALEAWAKTQGYK